MREALDYIEILEAMKEKPFTLNEKHLIISGFQSGYEKAQQQVKKLNIDDVSKCLKFVPSKNSEFYCAKCDELKEFHEEY